MSTLESFLTTEQRAAFSSLDTPYKIQAFLDDLPYVGENRNRSPLGVIHDGQCHCYDGALLAAAALRRIGYPPQVIDLWPEPGTDDDHVLAIYQVNQHWGALAKSNFAGLRFREPVYRSLRELVMSFFENFFNMDGVKTLRTYTVPLNLRRYDAQNWETEEAAVDRIEKHLHRLRTFPVITPQMAANLSPVDQRTYQAGMFGTNPEGLFKTK
jgi:hypothetical protein